MIKNNSIFYWLLINYLKKKIMLIYQILQETELYLLVSTINSNVVEPKRSNNNFVIMGK